MVRVEGYWKVRLVCLIALVSLITILYVHHSGGSSEQIASPTSDIEQFSTFFMKQSCTISMTN